MKTNWRLPRGVDELLPPDAWELETLRRRVLDLFVSWGFDYVEPPIIEYLEALLVGSGEDLDLQTLKVVDQASGRQLGIRADMTSQAVRIDAHSRRTEGVQRLCYAGPVVFANPVLAQTSRVPVKAGAELFGSPSLRADAEIINLMLAAVQAAGVQHPVLLLGHMGIFRALVAELDQTGVDPVLLFAAVQRKSAADIEDQLADAGAAERDIARMLTALPHLMGDTAVLDKARDLLAGAPEPVSAALSDLRELVTLIAAEHPEVSVRVDIAELSGYGYHNGPVFAVYHPTHGKALAQGGRYDDVGEAFNRPRPATGFDMNLKALLSPAAQTELIFAPWVDADKRAAQVVAIQQLRAAGQRVWQGLSAEEKPPAQCSKALTEASGEWQVAQIHTDG